MPWETWKYLLRPCAEHILGSWHDTGQHLRQGRCVVIGDEVWPEEELRGQEALVLHAAGLLAAAPGVPEAVALGQLLRGCVMLRKLLLSETPC